MTQNDSFPRSLRKTKHAYIDWTTWGFLNCITVKCQNSLCTVLHSGLDTIKATTLLLAMLIFVLLVLP